MRLARRVRFWIGAAIAFIAMIVLFIAAPGIAVFAPFIGVALGALAYVVLTATIRASRRKKRRQKFE